MKRIKTLAFPAVLTIICAALAVCLITPRKAVAVFGPAEAGFTLVIDAGHGGEDGGAVSVSGQKESELNLAIAKRTEDLAALLGIRTVMLRKTDISIYSPGCDTLAQKKISDLKNRVLAVAQAERPLLLSIHQNHFSQEKYRGAQVFYAASARSRQLAEVIQSDIRTALDPGNRRQCKPAEGVYLMEKIPCTGVLVECGFLSNFAEEQLLQDPAYQKKLAMTMLRGIALYGKVGDTDEI